MNEVDIGSIGYFNFPNFLNMMLRKVDEINAEEEIREAFKIYILERRWIHKQTRARICYGKFGRENDERRNRVFNQ